MGPLGKPNRSTRIVSSLNELSADPKWSPVFRARPRFLRPPLGGSKGSMRWGGGSTSVQKLSFFFCEVGKKVIQEDQLWIHGCFFFLVFFLGKSRLLNFS